MYAGITLLEEADDTFSVRKLKIASYDYFEISALDRNGNRVMLSIHAPLWHAALNKLYSSAAPKESPSNEEVLV